MFLCRIKKLGEYQSQTFAYHAALQKDARPPYGGRIACIASRLAYPAVCPRRFSQVFHDIKCGSIISYEIYVI